MKEEYHPVSLVVLRAALGFAGFKVRRIRCTGPAGKHSSVATYDVEIEEIYGVAQTDLSPTVVHGAAQQAFSRDVNVTGVRWNGGNWIICLRTGILNNDDLDSIKLRVGDNPTMVSPGDIVEVLNGDE